MIIPSRFQLLSLKFEDEAADKTGMNLIKLQKHLLPWAVCWTIYVVLILWCMIGPMPA